MNKITNGSAVQPNGSGVDAGFSANDKIRILLEGFLPGKNRSGDIQQKETTDIMHFRRCSVTGENAGEEK